MWTVHLTSMEEDAPPSYPPSLWTGHLCSVAYLSPCGQYTSVLQMLTPSPSHHPSMWTMHLRSVEDDTSFSRHSSLWTGHLISAGVDPSASHPPSLWTVNHSSAVHLSSVEDDTSLSLLTGVLGACNYCMRMRVIKDGLGFTAKKHRHTELDG